MWLQVMNASEQVMCNMNRELSLVRRVSLFTPLPLSHLLWGYDSPKLFKANIALKNLFNISFYDSLNDTTFGLAYQVNTMSFIHIITHTQTHAHTCTHNTHLVNLPDSMIMTTGYWQWVAMHPCIHTQHFSDQLESR